MTEQETGPSLPGGSRPFYNLRGGKVSDARGSAMIYIFMAIGLLAALTYTFSRESGPSVTVQASNQTAQELFSQANLISSAVLECTLSWPGGGPDVNANGIIESSENPNNPYPLMPTDADNPGGAAANDRVSNLKCIGAPSGYQNMFNGANNMGRFLPPPPSGWGEWEYYSVADATSWGYPGPAVGAWILMPSAGGAAVTDRLLEKFSPCQAQMVDYDGPPYFMVNIKVSACP